MQNDRTKRILSQGAALGLAWLLIPFAHAEISEHVEHCDSCHGQNGVSSECDMPTIAGVSGFVLEEYMLEYRDEARICRESTYRSGNLERPATDMCAVAKELSEAEITELAEHYASQEYAAAKQNFIEELAVEGSKVHKRECAKCHSDGGSLADDDAGILAGQWIPYLEQVFTDYAAGDRQMMDKKMKEKVDDLDAESINALIHYYASLQ